MSHDVRSSREYSRWQAIIWQLKSKKWQDCAPPGTSARAWPPHAMGWSQTSHHLSQAKLPAWTWSASTRVLQRALNHWACAWFNQIPASIHFMQPPVNLLARSSSMRRKCYHAVCSLLAHNRSRAARHHSHRSSSSNRKTGLPQPCKMEMMGAANSSTFKNHSYSFAKYFFTCMWMRG